MNNASAPSTTASPPPTTISADESNPLQKRALAQAEMTIVLLSRLLGDADHLVWVELAIVYYMDCSLFRLFIRAFSQLIFLTPKPARVPSTTRPYLQVILGTNLLCMLLHIFTARSEASEAMRFYLHGGAIPDIIGQKGPSSKIHLLFLDLLVTFIQCFMVAVMGQKEKISGSMERGPDVQTPETVPEHYIGQDLDAEERGLAGNVVASTGDIEMQTLNPATPSSVDDDQASISGDRERLLAEPEDAEDHHMDIFYSGTVILGEFSIWQTLRERLRYTPEGETESPGGFRAELAAAAADRRIDAVSRRVQRALTA